MILVLTAFCMQAQKKDKIIYGDYVISLEEVPAYKRLDSKAGYEKKRDKRGDLIDIRSTSKGISVQNNSPDSVKLMMLKLKGDRIINDWLQSGDKHIIQFSKLERGKYTLFISESKNSEVIKMLKVDKTPKG